MTFAVLKSNGPFIHIQNLYYAFVFKKCPDNFVTCGLSFVTLSRLTKTSIIVLQQFMHC